MATTNLKQSKPRNHKQFIIPHNKGSAITALLLTFLAVSASFAVLPIEAHTPPWTIPTYVYLSAAPNPVSLGQQTNLQYWFSVQPATSTSNTGYRWQNISIDITKPDGAIEHFGNLISDPSGQIPTK